MRRKEGGILDTKTLSARDRQKTMQQKFSKTANLSPEDLPLSGEGC
jgi:hypothetical protein